MPGPAPLLARREEYAPWSLGRSVTLRPDGWWGCIGGLGHGGRTPVPLCVRLW